jgi:hypothetical protein
LANVEAQQVVRVEEAVLRTHATLIYTISRAELAQLTLEVPADQKVVNVSSPNVRQWSVEAAGEKQKIVVELFEPARQSETIEVDLEQYSEQPDAAGADAAKDAAPKDADGKNEAANNDTAKLRSVVVPVVSALDVSRQQGVVVVDVAEGLQIEARTRDGLLQLDAADLPPALAKSPHELSYRYAVLPFRLVLDLTKIKPRVLADELVLVYLEPERLALQLQAIFTVERAGVFQFDIDVPAGFEIREVRGDACAGAQSVQVDSHHLEGDDKTRLVVNLAHKALGRVGLLVALEKRLDDANLLGPTGKTSEIPLAIPRVSPDTVERTNGRLVIYAPESLRANPVKMAGLRSVSLAEALAGMQAPPNLPTPNVPGGGPSAPYESAVNQAAAGRAVSSFVFTKAPVEVSLQVERRRPYVTAAQLLLARVDPGVVKYEATFYYDVRYSGVKSLRIDVPAELAAEIRNNTPGISEKLLDPQPDDVAKKDVAWSFSGERELLGPVEIHLTWQRRLDNLEVGKSVELDLPHLEPRGTDRAWGQIVLVKSETIDLLAAGKPTGLRPIDPQHDLMPGASVPDAALAFEFHDAWTLNITATRYQLESVKHTSIERGLVRTVVTRSGQLAVQALYRMRSARQRLAVILPASVEFDTEPLRINGRPTPLERGAQDEFFVPLAGRSTGEPFLLELRYALPHGNMQVELPAFADEPAVQKVFVSVFLPEELELLGYQGPWTDEQQWQYTSPVSRVPAPRYTDAGLVNWVREGVALTGSPTDSFPVDGQAFVFSTLRPEDQAAGSLRLTTMNGKWLHFLIFFGVMALGLLLLKRPLTERGAALAALLIALVLLGVFLPILATQIIYGGLWLALLLTLLVWFGVFLVQFSRRPRPLAVGAAPLPPGEAPPPLAEVSQPLAEVSQPLAEVSPPPGEVSPPPGESPPPADEPGQQGGTHE